MWNTQPLAANDDGVKKIPLKNKMLFHQFKDQKSRNVWPRFLQQPVIFESSVSGCLIPGSLIFRGYIMFNYLQCKLLYNLVNSVSQNEGIQFH